MEPYLFYYLQIQLSPSGAGDLIYLSKILQQSIYQLEQLRKITGTNEETLRLLRDTNRGLYEAMYVEDTINRTLKAGTFSKLRNLNESIQAVQSLYGRIPKTSEAQASKENRFNSGRKFTSS